MQGSRWSCQLQISNSKKHWFENFVFINIMKYQLLPQAEEEPIKIRHRRLQKSFYVFIGFFMAALVSMLIIIVLDASGLIKMGALLPIVMPQRQLSLVQTRDDLFKSNTQHIESELNKLKAIFHEQLLETSKLKIPTIDKSTYEYFTLDNGLKVLVIQDPSAQIAQAALCVNVGSWSEPDSFPGLAHFLEHMLFQGSHTYPQEGYFQKLVAENGGMTNAYTRVEETNYYFKINNDQVLQALQVFSHFFIDPLLDPSMVEREINAVNSEYEIAVSGDGWKIMHLLQLLSNKPVGRFTIGSLETLKEPMEALVKFHQTYYSANIMSLVVRSSYKDMAKWIREESDFSEIPNLNLKRRDKVPFPLKQTSEYVKYKVNGEKNTLILVYQLESPHAYKKAKPLELISQVIRSKHVDGLQDYLAKHKIALGLEAGTFLEGNGDFTFFMVELTLQEQANPVLATQAVIGYFNNMLDKFFVEKDKHEVTHTEYLEEVWNQYKKLSISQFNYLDKNNQPAVQKIAHNLNYFDYKEAISIDFLYEEFNPEIIYNYLSELVNPTNLVVLHGSPHFSELKHTSALYRLEYSVSSITSETIQKISSAITTNVIKSNIQAQKTQLPINLPKINNFVPQNFEIKTLCHDQSFIQAPLVFKSKEDCIQHEHEFETVNHYPQIIKRSLDQKVWWKLQRQFQVPQIFGGFLFSNPKSIVSLRDKSLVAVFNNLVTDTMNQVLQDAIDAGYQFQFTSTIKGVSLDLYGWSDNYHRLSEKVFHLISGLEFDSFPQVKQKLMIYYNNLYQDKAFRVTMTEYLNEVMQSAYYTPYQYMEELKQIKEEDVATFKESYFKNFRLVSFITGNVLRQEAEDIAHLVKKVFHKSSSHSQEEQHTFHVKDLKGKSAVVAITHRGGDENDINGVTLNYYQIGYRNKKNFAIMNLIQQFFHNQAFQYLRTERQLGYAVVMRFVPVGCIDGGVIVVQGTAQMPYQVNRHIEDFLQQFSSILSGLSEEQLEQMKFGAKSSLVEKDKSLYEEGSYIWNHIKNNNIVLEEREMAIAMIDDITKDDITEFYGNYFIKRHGKLSLQVYGKGLKENERVADNLLGGEELVSNLSDLKEHKCTYSLSNI